MDVSCPKCGELPTIRPHVCLWPKDPQAPLEEKDTYGRTQSYIPMNVDPVRPHKELFQHREGYCHTPTEEKGCDQSSKGELVPGCQCPHCKPQAPSKEKCGCGQPLTQHDDNYCKEKQLEKMLEEPSVGDWKEKLKEMTLRTFKVAELEAFISQLITEEREKTIRDFTELLDKNFTEAPFLAPWGTNETIKKTIKDYLSTLE